MLRSRTASRFINFFIKEGQNNARLSDASMLAAPRKALMDLQKFANGGSLDVEILEYVKIRASQINGCAFCLSMHWRDSLKMGMRPDKLATLEAWREADWFTPQERAALAWTEALTHLGTHEVSDELYEACRAVYSEQEMIDLTVAIIAINNWNRLSVAFATQPEPFSLNGAQ